MPALSIHCNVYNTCAVILQRKGYQLWYDEKAELYFAEKDGWDFAGESLADVLAAVTIFEEQKPAAYQEYWWRIREPWVVDDLPGQPQPFNSVMKRAGRSAPQGNEMSPSSDAVGP